MSEPSFETLEEFKDWLISPEGPGILGAVPVEALTNVVEGAVAITVYRKGRFQAELFYGWGQKLYTITPSEQAQLGSIFVGGEMTVEIQGGGTGGILKEASLRQVGETKDPREVPNPSRGLYASYTTGMPVSFSFGEDGGIFLILKKQLLEGTPVSCLENMEIEDIPEDEISDEQE